MLKVADPVGCLVSTGTCKELQHALLQSDVKQTISTLLPRRHFKLQELPYLVPWLEGEVSHALLSLSCLLAVDGNNIPDTLPK